MTIFKIILNTGWWLIFSGFVFSNLKAYTIYRKLMLDHRVGGKAFGTWRIRDFKQLEQNATDINFKKKIHELIFYHQLRRTIFFGGLLFMVILMTLGGMFRWM